ncbi:hypothetical protein MAR_025359 [Mya arenaria]|uniref:Uncharacterized protein n=1 Tax=Mya arenaria TaxID=6604 RepID=A0ABY7DWK6_MYAAR|nr:hypothetical protein MAR_025359 [Mya arenaria]
MAVTSLFVAFKIVETSSNEYVHDNSTSSNIELSTVIVLLQGQERTKSSRVGEVVSGYNMDDFKTVKVYIEVIARQVGAYLPEYQTVCFSGRTPIPVETHLLFFPASWRVSSHEKKRRKRFRVSIARIFRSNFQRSIHKQMFTEMEIIQLPFSVFVVDRTVVMIQGCKDTLHYGKMDTNCVMVVVL